MVSHGYSAVGRSLVKLLRLMGAAFVLLSFSLSSAQESFDIQTSDEYVEFVRAVAMQTALADAGRDDVVKLLLLGAGENGEVLVLKLGLLTGDAHAHTDDFSSGLKVALIVHVHHGRMKQMPGADDSLTVRHYGVPNVVISSDGQRIWEVGVVAGRNVYREIAASRVGDWQVIE